MMSGTWPDLHSILINQKPMLGDNGHGNVFRFEFIKWPKWTTFVMNGEFICGQRFGPLE